MTSSTTKFPIAFRWLSGRAERPFRVDKGLKKKNNKRIFCWKRETPIKKVFRSFDNKIIFRRAIFLLINERKSLLQQSTFNQSPLINFLRIGIEEILSPNDLTCSQNGQKSSSTAFEHPCECYLSIIFWKI